MTPFFSLTTNTVNPCLLLCQTELKNISSRRSSILAVMEKGGNILSAGRAMGQNTTIGYLILCSMTVKLWIAGWLLSGHQT